MYMLRWISAILHDAPRRAVGRALAHARPALGGASTSCRSWPACSRSRSTRTPSRTACRDSLHGIVSAVTAGGRTRDRRSAAAIATPPVQIGAILPARSCSSSARSSCCSSAASRAASARVTSGVIGLVSFAGAASRPGTSGTTATARPSAASSRPTATPRSCRRSCARSGVACVAARLGHAPARRAHRGVLLACSASRAPGMCILAAANGFVSLFVALELFSIALYVLCALDVEQRGVAGERPQVPRSRARSARPPCCSAAAWPTSRPARCASTRSARRSTPGDLAHGHPAVRHRADRRRARVQGHRRRRSTCGRPTSTRARRRPSWRSWRRPPRRSRWPRCCACMIDGVLARERRLGERRGRGRDRVDADRQRRRAARRPTSSACSRTRASARPATC